jgi:hypothetical protein
LEAGTRRGYIWPNVANLNTGFTTILGPNSELCLHNWIEGNWSASSRHQGGAHVCMGDDAIKFVTDSIDTGDDSMLLNGSTPQERIDAGDASPYGLWDALGTCANRETIDQEL